MAGWWHHRRLSGFGKAPITIEKVLKFVTEMQPTAEAPHPNLLWSGERYARNLIYRDSLLEVLAPCRMPGQRTRIHLHNGQLGWVTPIESSNRFGGN
jgi:cysteine dioxygenase